MSDEQNNVPEERFPTVPGTSARGGAIRSARREAGMTIGAAARTLRIPVTTLVQLELGQAVFTEPNDYGRAANLIRMAAMRGAKEREETT